MQQKLREDVYVPCFRQIESTLRVLVLLEVLRCYAGDINFLLSGNK